MKQVLIVDDEKPFLLSVEQGLKSRLKKTKILTAQNGVEALAMLQLTPVDLLVTDLKMPVMDGFELLSNVSRDHTGMPVIVMTALGAPEVQEKLGAIRCIEKPMDLATLSDTIQQALDSRASGFVQGITLPTFAQLMEMEKKSCTLEVRAEKQVGRLVFDGGRLVDVTCGDLDGEEAAYEVLAWGEVSIEMEALEAPPRQTIHAPLNHLLLEALRLKDEKEWAEKEDAFAAEEDDLDLSDMFSTLPESETGSMPVMDASLQAKLAPFSVIEGFFSVGVFTPGGELQAKLEAENCEHPGDMGNLVNRLVQNSQKASDMLGTGAGQLLHIEAEQAHIMIRCLPGKPEPRHLVLILRPGASIGMARLKMGKIVTSLQPEPAKGSARVEPASEPR